MVKQMWRKTTSGGGGGIVAALLVGAGAVVAAWWMVSGRKRRRRVRHEEQWEKSSGGVRDSAGLLRESILGADRSMVQSVFGPPRAAGGGMAAVPDQGRQAYWEAETWYYALDPKQRTALAITFREGVAREVEFVDGDRGRA